MFVFLLVSWVPVKVHPVLVHVWHYLAHTHTLTCNVWLDCVYFLHALIAEKRTQESVVSGKVRLAVSAKDDKGYMLTPYHELYTYVHSVGHVYAHAHTHARARAHAHMHTMSGRL